MCTKSTVYMIPWKKACGITANNMNLSQVWAHGEFMLESGQQHEPFSSGDQWPAVSYRYRIEKVSDTFFWVSRKVSEKFQSIGIVSGKKSKFQSRFDTFRPVVCIYVGHWNNSARMGTW